MEHKPHQQDHHYHCQCYPHRSLEKKNFGSIRLVEKVIALNSLIEICYKDNYYPVNNTSFIEYDKAFTKTSPKNAYFSSLAAFSNNTSCS